MRVKRKLTWLVVYIGHGLALFEQWLEDLLGEQEYASDLRMKLYNAWAEKENAKMSAEEFDFYDDPEHREPVEGAPVQRRSPDSWGGL